MFPWIAVADVCNYFGDIYMSLTDFSCQDEEMCAVISATCPCKNPVLALPY